MITTLLRWLPFVRRSLLGSAKELRSERNQARSSQKAKAKLLDAYVHAKDHTEARRILLSLMALL